MTDNNTGWVCPKCQKVNAPKVKSCKCTKPTNEGKETTQQLLVE